MILRRAAGIHLVLEPQQDEVAGLVRAEAGHFDVVAEQVGILGNFVVRPAEELFLVIEARTPGQVRADLQILADAMAEHVHRVDAFGGIHVVRATSGVDVMIARPPAELRRIDPAFHLEVGFCERRRDGHRDDFGDGFGATRELDGVVSFRQANRFSVRAINLRVKGKVGREPLGLRRIDAALRVANDERRHGGLAVLVHHAEDDGARGQAAEENIDLAAEAEILGALADIEGEPGFALADVAAVEGDDAVLDLQSAQRLAHRLAIIHFAVEPAIGDIALR